MTICAMHKCGSRTGRDGLRMFNIPAVITNQCDRTRELSIQRRSLWLSRINRADLREKDVRKYHTVCGKHFLKGAPSKLFDNTNPDWAPSLNLGYQKSASKTQENAAASLKRYTRAEARREKRKRNDRVSNAAPSKRAKLNNTQMSGTLPAEIENFEPPEENQGDISKNSDSNINVKSIFCQTDCTGDETSELQKNYDSAVQDNFALRGELVKLRKNVKASSVDKDNLEKDDKKVTFYTGLPSFVVLMHVFRFVSCKIEQSHRNSLSKFQEFIMVLMRLRLNLLEQDLAYRFGVTQPTVCNIFNKWIPILSHRLKKLIVWPEREILRATMPECFKAAFGSKVAIIIDCFEVFIERPTSLLPRAETWSQYKHHNTVKLLIGITPQGTIAFISRAWVGRASDKCITENSGILEKLLPGDVVLADRGFDIADSVGMYRAKLNIPAFTKSKTQLPAEDVQGTRNIANVRIHVERVIGLVRRKYRMLEATLPTELLKVKAGDSLASIDHIVTTCCALTNLCPSVVTAASA